MSRPETPEQYQGSPDDVVNARRAPGFGHVRLEPSELQPGMPACECHPADADRPETSLGIIHEGDIVRMRRSEVVGFFRDTPEGPVWNEGRADFELASEPDQKPDQKPAPKPAPKRPARAAAATPAPIPQNVPDIDPNAVSVDPNAPADIPAADQAQQ